MTRIIIKELILDIQNLDHIKKHNVNENEVLEAGRNLVYHKKTYNDRYLAIGRSGKRILTVVIRRIASGKYYLVTARDSDKKERRKLYEKESQQNS